MILELVVWLTESAFPISLEERAEQQRPWPVSYIEESRRYVHVKAGGASTALPRAVIGLLDSEMLLQLAD